MNSSIEEIRDIRIWIETEEMNLGEDCEDAWHH